MGNSWSKPESKGDGFISKHSVNGTLVSGKTTNNGKRIDSSNHTHLHKDGVTVTHNGQKTTVKKGGG